MHETKSDYWGPGACGRLLYIHMYDDRDTHLDVRLPSKGEEILSGWSRLAHAVSGMDSMEVQSGVAHVVSADATNNGMKNSYAHLNRPQVVERSSHLLQFMRLGR